MCSELLSCLQNFNLRIFPSLCLAVPKPFLGFFNEFEAAAASEARLRDNLTDSKVEAAEAGLFISNEDLDSKGCKTADSGPMFLTGSNMGGTYNKSKTQLDTLENRME